MCTNTQPIEFNAAQAQATMKSGIIGAGIVMIVLGTVGLAIALTAGGHLADARAAYSAGLAGILLAGIMVIAVGALLGHRTLLRHQLVIDAHLNKRLDAIEDQHKRLDDQYQRLEQLMARISQNQETQATIVGNALEDELRHHRRDRRGS